MYLLRTDGARPLTEIGKMLGKRDHTTVMHGTETTGWLYGNPPPGRPADLGYFIGYRIAEAYYAQAADKAAALRDILRVQDVERILAASGYSP